MSHSIEERKASNQRYLELILTDDEIPRDDSALIQTIEELGTEGASGRFCELKIVEIPEDVEWQIEEYDGLEWIAESHRTWR